MKVTVKWEPRDLWVGVYREPSSRRTFVCLLPCLPVIFERKGRR